MDYRDERDALRGRVERLEQELAEAQSELAEARRREGEAVAEGSRAEAARLERLTAALPEAEGLVQRLRRELATVEAMRAAHEVPAPEKEAEGNGPAAPKPRMARSNRFFGCLMSLLPVALAVGLGFSEYQRVQVRRRVREMEPIWQRCAQATIGCCNPGPSLRPDDPLCVWAAKTCSDYGKHFECPKGPPTVLLPPAPTERPDPHSRDERSR
jgi:hypothetical protein